MMFNVITLLGLCLFVYYVFPVVEVIGYSMFPTYKNGEIIFGTKLYRKSKLKVGDVIIYKCPTEENRMVIKRIDVIDYDLLGNLIFYCLGDNTDDSYDSRYYGFISSKSLVCKIINQRRKSNVCD